MADEKKSDEKLSPLQALEAAHLKGVGARRAAIEQAMGELKAAQKLLEDARLKVARLQQENIEASFAHDAKLAELAAA